MAEPNTPRMSVVIVTAPGYQRIRNTIAHLRAQTVKEHLEIVMVAPSAEDLGLIESELKDFCAYRVVELAPFTTLSKALAAGIGAASGPVVVLAEDHSFPDPDWAEALIAAHRGPWAAVGPVLANANPAGMISWSNFLLEYGPWIEPGAAGPTDHVPGRNSSYKREVLLAYGPRLDAMLEAEMMLHEDLRAQGHQLCIEPKARTHHFNISSPTAWLIMRLHNGRIFAASRARAWPLRRRLLWALAAPLIPLVRLRRIVRQIRRPDWKPHRLLPRILPALIVSLVVDAAGELVGYLIGSGEAMRKLTEAEFNVQARLNRRDRPLLAAQ